MDLAEITRTIMGKMFSISLQLAWALVNPYDRSCRLWLLHLSLIIVLMVSHAVLYYTGTFRIYF